MKKILHIINGEFFAGAERVQDLLALRLSDHGYECGFVCLKEGVFDKSRKSKVPVHIIPMQTKFDFSIVSRIAKIVTEGGYSAVHAHTPRSALIGRFVAMKTGVPFFYHVHSPASRDTENSFRNVLNSAMERMFIFPACQRLIPVSYSLKNYLLEKGVNSQRVVVIPNGVPVVRESPIWQAPVGAWTIGTVALFRPRKGLEILLQAMRRLLNDGNNVVLLAVGTFESPEYQASIMKLVADLDLGSYITWTGFTRDVHSQMEKMHVFVLPSLFGEGLPMVVIEAMSVGVPVVASGVEGIPEVLNSDAIGIVTEPNNPLALANAISKLINNPSVIPAMVNAAHTRQRELYSDVAMSNKLAEIYDAVIAVN
jgi:glycosyltransferase involved in cell wall biosynthesis